MIETKMLEAVRAAKGELYLVGGALRDELLGMPLKDADYLVSGLSLEALRAALESFARVDAVGASFGVLKVSADGTVVDVALPRTERSTGLHHREFIVDYDASLAIEADLGRRDFTVNALARRLSDGALIDPFGGRRDLERRQLRAVGDPEARFSEDPLRMLRAARFVAKLGFTLEPDTAAAIRLHSSLISSVAPERVQVELWGLLSAQSPDAVLAALRLLRDTGLLGVILPEFVGCIGFDQANPHHHLGLEEHIFQAVRNAVRRGASPLARLALLLHDIAKPETQSWGADGVAHYYQHEQRSADMARGLLERLRFSAEVVHQSVKLIANHMRPPRAASQQSLRRFKRDLGALWPDALEIRLADRLAHVPENFDATAEFERCMSILAALPAELEGFSEQRLAISGQELMQHFKLEPGPAVGQLKRRAAQAVIDGELQNERAAILEWLQRHPDIQREKD